MADDTHVASNSLPEGKQSAIAAADSYHPDGDHRNTSGTNFCTAMASRTFFGTCCRRSVSGNLLLHPPPIGNAQRLKAMDNYKKPE